MVDSIPEEPERPPQEYLRFKLLEAGKKVMVFVANETYDKVSLADLP
jgi:hypothetical protein